MSERPIAGLRAVITVHMDDGTERSIPVTIQAAMMAGIVAKAERENIPLHILAADYYWHQVARILGTTQGWSLVPVDGHTLPLPRPGIAPDTYRRNLDALLADWRNTHDAGH